MVWRPYDRRAQTHIPPGRATRSGSDDACHLGHMGGLGFETERFTVEMAQ